MRKIDASYRIMKIFKMLHESPRSLDEICDELYLEDICVNKETISKYFKTLRKFGCIMGKRFGKFELRSVPFSLDLSDDDFFRLAVFENLAKCLYGDDVCDNLKSSLKKILSLVDCKSLNVYSKHLSRAEKVNNISRLFHDKISKLLKLGYENSKIRVVHKGEKINLSHISFKYSDNAVFVHIFNEDTKNYQLLLLEDIEEIVATPQSSFASVFAPHTVFSLKGALKNSYNLYEGERVIKVEEDSILVSNNFEDKKQLLKRLMRYGELCRVLSPEYDVQNFKQMLDNTLKNLSKIS